MILALFNNDIIIIHINQGNKFSSYLILGSSYI